MNTQHVSNNSLRALIVAVAVLVASIFASGPAAASTLIPMVDLGAPAGGGGTAQVVENEVASRGQVSAF